MAENEMGVEVDYGRDFFAEQVSVSHSPIRFVIDFVRSTPRIDGASQSTKVLTSHSVLMLDPYLAKEFLSVLSDNVSKYEKKFGKIEKPSPLQKFEKDAEKQGKAPVKQDYFG